MSQKLPVNGFQQVEDISEFDESFIKSYNEESHEGYFPEVDVQYPKKLHELHNDLPFLSEKKVEKLVATLNDEEEYAVHMHTMYT